MGQYGVSLPEAMGLSAKLATMTHEELKQNEVVAELQQRLIERPLRPIDLQCVYVHYAKQSSPTKAKEWKLRRALQHVWRKSFRQLDVSAKGRTPTPVTGTTYKAPMTNGIPRGGGDGMENEHGSHVHMAHVPRLAIWGTDVM